MSPPCPSICEAPACELRTGMAGCCMKSCPRTAAGMQSSRWTGCPPACSKPPWPPRMRTSTRIPAWISRGSCALFGSTCRAGKRWLAAAPLPSRWRAACCYRMKATSAHFAGSCVRRCWPGSWRANIPKTKSWPCTSIRPTMAVLLMGSKRPPRPILASRPPTCRCPNAHCWPACPRRPACTIPFPIRTER